MTGQTLTCEDDTALSWASATPRSSTVEVPVRIDLAGGWLDVPAYARTGAYVVNVTVVPGLSASGPSPYHYGGGVGGSAAASILNGDDAMTSELARAGWQDPAVILETGLCVWRSGPWPVLELKRNPDWLAGKLALLWTGAPHVQGTGDLLKRPRPYDAIEKAGRTAYEAICKQALGGLADAMHISHAAQCAEGMEPLQPSSLDLAYKYAGSGWGGYAAYLFANSTYRAEWLQIQANAGREAFAVEPYMRGVG